MHDSSKEIPTLVKQAQLAQQQIVGYSQKSLDELTHAVAWAVMEPKRNQLLSEKAVADTGLGNVADKVVKNHRKTLGLLRDLRGRKTTGIISENPKKGITEIARPLGVVAALTPSTNPIATPVNKIINSLKCGNAVIVAPSPKGADVAKILIGYIHQEFDKIGAPRHLVQQMPMPVNKSDVQELMQIVDFVVVTGSQSNVRRAYSSGTSTIGVGTGNVTTIIDASADVENVAEKIKRSKTFDNATSCSSENNVICLEEHYQDFIKALQKQGGLLLNLTQRQQLLDGLWPEGKLNVGLIAQSANTLAKAVGIESSELTSMLVVEHDKNNLNHPFCRERMSPVLTLFKVRDFSEAKHLANQLLEVQGAGHSLGIHSNDEENILQLGLDLPTCRVIVNQAHSIATGGAFNNGMPFSLSMGCGSWGKNSISTNLNVEHFMNVTRIIREIEVDEPTVASILGEYIAKNHS